MNKNTHTALNLLMIVAGMAMLSYAFVPLYKLFCAKTGFGGTTQTAKKLPHEIINRVITVRFNADTDPRLGWEFSPEQREVKVKLGESGLAFFKARNIGSETTSGTAMYNVTPLKTGGYFNKIQCFCFKSQSIRPGQSVDFPVSFFVDPALAHDKGMEDIDTITLSYTFYLTNKADK